MKEKNTVLAGLSYLLFIFLGVLPALVIYFITKDSYAKTHAKQAFILGVGVSFISLILFGSFFAITGSLTILQEDSYLNTATTIIIDMFFVVLAVMAFKGKEFSFFSESESARYWRHWTGK